jgi:OFA family oxalate/formate antiporter-like MFS transporter
MAGKASRRRASSACFPWAVCDTWHDQVCAFPQNGPSTMSQPGNSSDTIPPAPASASWLSSRWVQLTAGIIGMVAVANFQYAWTLFVGPLHAHHGWTEVQIQDALFFFFIPAQTWLVPLEAYLADRFGPRRLLFLGGILAALAWVMNAFATSLATLYVAQILSGCGSGIVYSLSMGNALKWFPDRRGLAAGLTAAAFGVGSALTVRPIRLTIEHFNYASAFLWFGLGQGLVIITAGLVMRFPRAGETPAPTPGNVLQSQQDCTPRKMLKSPAFWLLYGMMTVGAIPGLLMVVTMAPMAKDFDVDEKTVTLLWVITSAALPLALELDRVMGGLTRPLFGWLSDHIGREAALFLAFTLEALSLLLLMLYGHDPAVFVFTSGLAFFGWGAVFSLFPALSGDMFGRKFATTNYAWLYTAKGASSLLASLCTHLKVASGSWELVFAVMIAFDLVAALLALLVLRPLRARWQTQDG